MFVGEAFRSLTANVSTTVAATLTVLIAMFVLGLFIALGTWSLSWSHHIESEVIVKVFFQKTATPSQINAVRDKLAAMDDVGDVTFVSKQDALARMKKRYPDLTQNLAWNPFPDAFEVKPKQASDVGLIADRFNPPPPGVEKVDYGKKKTKRVLTFAKVLEVIFLVGSGILLTASTMLIANTIRLSLFSRRREIEVMKLVGATNWFVRGPFMLEGLLCGFVGAVAAVFLLVLTRELALPRIPALHSTSDEASALPFPYVALILFGVSLLVGAAGSGITLRRFLRI
jgi:cell division transport system permease protein